MSIYLMERRFFGIGLLGTVVLVMSIQVIFFVWMARSGHIGSGLTFHCYLNGVLLFIWMLVISGSFKIGISKGVEYRRSRIDQDLPGTVHVIFSVTTNGAYDKEQFLHRVFHLWNFIPSGAGQDAGRTEWFRLNLILVMVASLLILAFAYQRTVVVGTASLFTLFILLNYVH